MRYDLLVIGSGPGGYVAALRGAQLGMRTAIVEREKLGGVCLNWGCIPTKALLQSAHAFEVARNAGEFGVVSHGAQIDTVRVVERSREVANTMSKGVLFLLNRARVDILEGHGKLLGEGKVEVQRDAETLAVEAKHIIIATGARARELPILPIDGEHILGYREALVLSQPPKSLAIIGSGAIGSELALYFSTVGCQVTLVEAQERLLPLEDEDVSKAIGRAFRKAKIKTLTGVSLQDVDVEGGECKLRLQGKKGEEVITAEKVISAVGIAPNVEWIGLEEVGVKLERGRIAVDEHYQTSVPGIYAIGDVIPTIALAHVASAEAHYCVEHIAGLTPHPIDYSSIPACTYTSPEVGSVGKREHELKRDGVEYIVGTFPFTANGKATAMGARDGMVKLLFESGSHRLLGAHLVGGSATELIGELALALKQGLTAEQIHTTVHAHPTLCEAVMEAAAAALGCCVHA